jgi:hypothetical protein
VFWGGEDWRQVFGDGAAYDPAADRWRPLPDSPLAARISAAELWTGTEALFWGGSNGTYNNYMADGAAYSPSTDRWRRLPAWSGRIADSVWTGREMIVWGGIVPVAGGSQLAEIKSTNEGRRYVP